MSTEVKRGTILESQNGYRVQVLHIKKHDDRPDDLVLGAIEFRTSEGTPLEMNGTYTMEDIRSGKLRVVSADEKVGRGGSSMDPKTPTTRPEIVTEEHLSFLDDLRSSGETNMFGARPFVQKEFGIGKDEAQTILKYWMESFEERHPSLGTESAPPPEASEASDEIEPGPDTVEPAQDIEAPTQSTPTLAQDRPQPTAPSGLLKTLAVRVEEDWYRAVTAARKGQVVTLNDWLKGAILAKINSEGGIDALLGRTK